MTKKVSIIIVYYRAKKEFFDCLKSIEESKIGNSYEVIVVDNEEKDSIRKELKKRFPWVIYLKSPGNIGFGSANNLGARSAKGEFLFLVNPDTIFLKGTVDGLVKFLSAHERIGIVAPLLLDKGHRPYQQGSLTLTPKRAVVAFSFLNRFFPNNPISRQYFLSDWDQRSVREVEVVPGTALMVKKAVFQKIGGFDINFFMYFEESDFCKRVKENGYKIYINPKARLVHLGAASSGGIKLEKLEKIFQQSRFYYFKKHHGIFKALLVHLFLSICRPRVKLYD